MNTVLLLTSVFAEAEQNKCLSTFTHLELTTMTSYDVSPTPTFSDGNIHNVYENLLGRVGLASDCLHHQAIFGLTSSMEFVVFPLHSFSLLRPC